MRVGALAKGLLLRNERDVELVVLCTDTPTTAVLDKVLAQLPKQFGVRTKLFILSIVFLLVIRITVGYSFWILITCRILELIMD